jgi:hypothetical protein
MIVETPEQALEIGRAIAAREPRARVFLRTPEPAGFVVRTGDPRPQLWIEGCTRFDALELAAEIATALYPRLLLPRSDPRHVTLPRYVSWRGQAAVVSLD